MTRIGYLAWAAMVVGALEPVARAQPATVDTPSDPATGPAFVNLQRFDATSRAGVEVTTFDPFQHTSTQRRWELFGQWVEPTHRVGAYLRLPYTTREESDLESGRALHNSALGNPAVGAIWIPRLSTALMAVVVHVGIALPSGDSQDYLAFRGVLTRPHELFSAFTHWVTASGGASLLFAGEHVFARLDGGIDVNVLTFDPNYEPRLPAIHGNAGVGFRGGPVSIGGELSTLTVITRQQLAYASAPPDEFESVDVLATLAMSIRYRTRRVEPYAALVIPMREQQRFVFDRAVIIGVEAVLP